MVCASLSSCHGGPWLWQTQIRICKRGISRPFPPRTFFSCTNPSIFLSLPFPYPTPPFFPLLPLLWGLGYYYGKTADARRRDLAHSGDQNLPSDHHDYYRERLPL
jgi:hypothetical protein